MTSDQIHAAIIKSILTVAPSMRELGPATALSGEDASLDSVGFLTFLVTLEGELNGRIDLTALLEDASVGEDGPFRTVATLAEVIDQKLNDSQ